MKTEYLIFNILVFTGPFFLGLLKPFRFKYWAEASLSIFLVMIPYIVWDAIVTGYHWMFNESYVLGIYLAKLPIEEWLFFITVPFACLFTWEMIIRRVDLKTLSFLRKLRNVVYILPLVGALLFLQGRQYTGLVFIFLSLAVFLDIYLKTDLLLQTRFYRYLLLIIIFTLVFNGYLTWRPVVLYGQIYQLDFRVFTIPIEDFGYGISLMYLNTIIFEKLKIRNVSTQNLVLK
jgi:lycopene cyclase domain-containing protein